MDFLKSEAKVYRLVAAAMNGLRARLPVWQVCRCHERTAAWPMPRTNFFSVTPSSRARPQSLCSWLQCSIIPSFCPFVLLSLQASVLLFMARAGGDSGITRSCDGPFLNRNFRQTGFDTER